MILLALLPTVKRQFLCHTSAGSADGHVNLKSDWRFGVCVCVKCAPEQRIKNTQNPHTNFELQICESEEEKKISFPLPPLCLKKKKREGKKIRASLYYQQERQRGEREREREGERRRDRKEGRQREEEKVGEGGRGRGREGERERDRRRGREKERRGLINYLLCRGKIGSFLALWAISTYEGVPWFLSNLKSDLNAEQRFFLPLPLLSLSLLSLSSLLFSALSLPLPPSLSDERKKRLDGQRYPKGKGEGGRKKRERLAGREGRVEGKERKGKERGREGEEGQGRKE
ncbi:hypothetical protein L345_04656, partial [Ophiophagus hannah]